MRRLILMISAAVVAVAACGGGSSPAEGDDASEETEEESTSVAAFFGFDPNDPDAAAANSARLSMRQQELVATCMTNQGFEYVPAVVPIDGQDFVFDEEEYARERGFGISTSTWLTDGGSTSADGVTVEFGSAPDQWEDPNQAIVEALSESEREAYNNTLYGEISELEFSSDLSDSESEPTDEDLWGGGCMGEAAKEVYGMADEAFRELESLFDELQQRVESDPRVVEASEGWTACMADRGYDYQTVDELWTGLDEYHNRYNELVNISDPFEGWTEEDIENFFETSSEEAISDFYAQNQSEARQGVDQEALAALQQEEKDLAVANYECGEKQREVTQEVTEEFESQFIAENRDVLEQARDSLDLN